ncbi:MAG TPA: c-type cytochrome, partial [Vicinamibacterales bacterium]|nr:c-type cytochrome [Vicinamibacterales bacterium]
MTVLIISGLLLLRLQAPAQTAAGAAPGAQLFAEACATCHGADAKGDNGPDLTTLWASGATDERVAETIRRGVPGSVMPASRASDADIRAIVAYLKSLAPPAAGAADGTRAAAERPQRVTLVTRNGARIRGERRNEDAFSIQIAESNGRLQGYLKNDLQEIVRGDVHDEVDVPAGRSGDRGISYHDILDGLKDPSRWLTFSGDYSGRRHSPITQITRDNVDRLAPEWTFQTGTMTRGRGFEATPLVWDGVLYV